MTLQLSGGNGIHKSHKKSSRRKGYELLEDPTQGIERNPL